MNAGTHPPLFPPAHLPSAFFLVIRMAGRVSLVLEKDRCDACNMFFVQNAKNNNTSRPIYCYNYI